jgi:hypothetical protein
MHFYYFALPDGEENILHLSSSFLYNFAAKRLSLSTQVTQNTQYTSFVPFYGAAPWKQQHLPPIALVPMHPYHLNMPQYMPPTKL